MYRMAGRDQKAAELEGAGLRGRAMTRRSRTNCSVAAEALGTEGHAVNTSADIVEPRIVDWPCCARSPYKHGRSTRCRKAGRLAGGSPAARLIGPVPQPADYPSCSKCWSGWMTEGHDGRTRRMWFVLLPSRTRRSAKDCQRDFARRLSLWVRCWPPPSRVRIGTVTFYDGQGWCIG